MPPKGVKKAPKRDPGATRESQSGAKWDPQDPHGYLKCTHICKKVAFGHILEHPQGPMCPQGAIFDKILLDLEVHFDEFWCACACFVVKAASLHQQPGSAAQAVRPLQCAAAGLGPARNGVPDHT